MKISHILATKGANVITIRPEQSLKVAGDLLSRHNIGALVVVDESNRMVGILSERDMIRALAHEKNVLRQLVAAIMTREVITGSPQDDVRSVLLTMSEHKIRHLPIIERGHLAGMISIRDVIQVQLNEYEGEIDTLEVIISAQGEDG